MSSHGGGDRLVGRRHGGPFHDRHGRADLLVIIAGLIIGHESSRHSMAASRLQTTAVWRLVDFLLEGLVFLLIGQQLFF